ncbi:MAG: hypothetical protein H0U70_03235 [Tatlockia sp.]|nr:hypothetical protein [Tatlockia sp.]
MTRALKEILLDMVNLTLADQRWILANLREAEGQIFNQLQGERLLQEARRFRNLKKIPGTEPQRPQLANFHCQALKNYCSLYISILLEQGQFSWQQQFLSFYDPNQTIRKTLRSAELKHLKIAAKQALLEHWQNKQSFSHHLEQKHG